MRLLYFPIDPPVGKIGTIAKTLITQEVYLSVKEEKQNVAAIPLEERSTKVEKLVAAAVNFGEIGENPADEVSKKSSSRNAYTALAVITGILFLIALIVAIVFLFPATPLFAPIVGAILTALGIQGTGVLVAFTMVPPIAGFLSIAFGAISVVSGMAAYSEAKKITRKANLLK